MDRNRLLRIALVAVPLLLTYPAAAWLVGQRVEAAIARNYQLLDENPSLRIVARDYRRGIFSASETLTLEVFGNLAPWPGASLLPASAGEGAPLRLTIRSHIRHGPLPGLASVGAATVDSELLADAPLRERLAEILGDEKPLQLRSEYRFDGGGSSTLRIPAFSTYWPAREGAGRDTLAWDGLTLNLDFAAGMQRYSLHAEAPRLELKGARGGQLTMLGVRLEGTQQRVFADEPLLYAGVQKLSMARLIVGGGEGGGEPVDMRRVRCEAEVPVKGDYIDLVARLGSESLRVGGRDYGPANYDFSLRHLHARTAAAFYREVMRLSADPALQAAALEAPATLLASLATPGMELLRHGPELGIDRLAFRSPHGDASLVAHFRVNGAQTQDLGNPLTLLAKLDADADILLPEGLLGEMAAAGDQGVSGAGDAVDAAVGAPAAAFGARLADFVARGLVARNGAMLRSRLAFSKGRLTVNGRPFDPIGMRVGGG